MDESNDRELRMDSEKVNRFRAALVQLRAGRAIEENLISAEALIRKAARGGADYIQTPENTALMELEPELVQRQAQPERESRPLALFCALAEELRVWLHIGSLGVKQPDGRIANRSYLLAPNGSVVARYDKLHMFDVDLPDGAACPASAGSGRGRGVQLHVTGADHSTADSPTAHDGEGTRHRHAAGDSGIADGGDPVPDPDRSSRVVGDPVERTTDGHADVRQSDP